MENFSPKGRGRTKALVLSIVVLCIVTAVVAFCVLLIVKNKESELEESLEKRLALLAGSRAEVISTWLSGLVNQGDRIVASDLFKLFAAQIDLLGEDVSLLVTGSLPAGKAKGQEVVELSEQLPMMQKLLDEFTRYADFRSGRIINRRGRTYLATDAGTNPLTPVDQAHVKAVLASKRPYFSPVRHTANGLVMDLFLPIEALQGDAPVAVLMLSKAVSDKINELLAKSPLMGEGERTRLIQEEGGQLQEIIPWMPGELTSLAQPMSFTGDILAFAVRDSLTESRRAYTFGRKVPELDWWIVQESDFRIARKAIRNYSRFMIVMGALMVLACVSSLGAIWWRLVGIENQRSARRFKELADRIDEQRRLLDSINNTITEFIALKDVRGYYQYVNPAFAHAMGRRAEEMNGLDDTALFGFDTAKRLEVSDHWVLANKQPKNFQIDLYIQSKLHHLQISKVPFFDQAGKITGLVSLFRDITEIVQVRKKSEKATRQTIETLVKAIEKTDPYLSGHSNLMQQIAQGVAGELNLGEQETATIEIAANLSQIGKMFVDKNLLNKPGKLTAEERQEVEQHVDHAASLLKDVEFELPVTQSVLQINELMDGTGYPQGLKAEAITMPARVLAVVNAFCAMVKPRAYRESLPPEQALSILAQAQAKYDQNVVQALEKVVRSPLGEKILRG
ncbi:MAG: PAS domain-containing protein [Desulfobacterales bacterium]|nr:PAS domain-containing protein [Desulfobacterales bacterium]